MSLQKYRRCPGHCPLAPRQAVPSATVRRRSRCPYWPPRSGMAAARRWPAQDPKGHDTRPAPCQGRLVSPGCSTAIRCRRLRHQRPFRCSILPEVLVEQLCPPQIDCTGSRGSMPRDCAVAGMICMPPIAPALEFGVFQLPPELDVEDGSQQGRIDVVRRPAALKSVP